MIGNCTIILNKSYSPNANQNVDAETHYVLVNVQCRGVYDSKPPDYEGVSPRGRCGLLS